MKRILAFLLCVILLCGCLPCAVFAGEETLSLSSCEEGKLKVALAAPAKQLIAAAYQNGKLRDYAVVRDCGSGEYSFSLPVCYQYKVFALDSDGAPLCSALEVKDDAAIVLREEEDVTLPTLDDSVAVALGAAVSEYAEISLMMQQLQTLFADEDAFAKLEGNHDLYLQYSGLLSETVGSLSDALPALTTLDAVTQKQIGGISKEIRLLSGRKASRQASDEVISWAEELTRQFDALEGNKRIQQLAKNMGCDVKTAYSALTAAQEALFNRYNAQADCYENWEKAMVAVKAASKVGFFVCATAATAGATTIAAVPAALSTGTVSAGGAAGILLGGVDVSIELSVDTAKIVLGGNSRGDKLVQHAEDKLKPVTDGLLLYSLCTLNAANAAEKLAFLGDIGQRGKELYDSITISDDGNGNLKANRTSLDNSDPAAAAELAEKKGLPSGEGKLDDGGETIVERVKEDYGRDRNELTELLKDEGIIGKDTDFSKLLTGYNEELIEEVNRNNEEDPDPIRPRQRIVETYDSTTGELSGVTCYDAQGRREWARYYGDGRVFSCLTCSWDESGDRIEVLTRYRKDPVSGVYTTQIDWIEQTKYVGGKEQKIAEIQYNENETIAEETRYFEGYSTHKIYDKNGLLSLHTVRYPNYTRELSYFTSNDPNVPYVERIGHLQHEYEYHEEFPMTVYTVKKEWEAVKRQNNGAYEYGWKCNEWGDGSFTSEFELIYSEPIED